MKVYGASIICVDCFAQPYPDDPKVRETFDLELGDDGLWRCERCRPKAPKRVSRSAAPSKPKALGDFERLLETECDRFEEACDEAVEIGGAEVASIVMESLKAFEAEIERGFVALEEALAVPPKN